MPEKIKHAVIIGSGNVGTHIANSLYKAGIIIDQVYSRNSRHAEKLAKMVRSTAINQVENIQSDSDIYIMAVSDDAIEPLSRNLSEVLPVESFVVHTSGSYSSLVFEKLFLSYGVLYPLQSLSRDMAIDLVAVPFCICANSEVNENRLVVLASRVSDVIRKINDRERLILHLAAVFANNFSNHMFVVAKSICDHYQVDFKLLLPLIQNTAAKIQSLPPIRAQTGPALRNDMKTIQKHLDLLKDNEEAKKLYEICTKSIRDFHDRS